MTISFLVKVSSSTASTNDLKIQSYFLPFTAGLTLAHQAEVHHVQSPAVKERENSLASLTILSDRSVASQHKHVCSHQRRCQGKRTAAEQVLQTVNYVCHLQRQVKELSAQREKMKVNSDHNPKVSFEKFCNKTVSFGGSDREYPAVKINSVGSGVQIWTNILERDIAYSDILLALEEDGLEVVSAASSAINNRVYHTIHAKVLDLNTFNMYTLYQKLWHLISTHQTKNADLRTTEASP